MKALSLLHHGVAGALCAFVSMHSVAQVEARPPEVQFVYMGSIDCPPCKEWLAHELPKLKQSEEFKRIRFSQVEKSIRSSVPPAAFLPADVKPLKAKLDNASGGRGGSPHMAFVVNGEVFDYYWGTRSAEEIIGMLAAIRSGTKYPFKRCLRLGNYGCEVRVSHASN